MSKDTETAEAPNLQPVEKGWEGSTKDAQKLADDYKKWAKKQSKQDWKAVEPIFDKLTNMMNDTSANAEADRTYYDEIFKPWTEDAMTSIEDTQAGVDSFGQEIEKLKADAEEYGSEANQRFMAGQAQAGVATAMEASTENSKRELQSYGVNPAAIQFGSLTYDLDAAKAAEQAGAGTQAAMDTRDTSRQMFNEALDREATKLGLDISVDQLRKGLVDTGEGVAERAITGQETAGSLGAAASGTKLAQSELEGKHRLGTTEFLDTLNQGLAGWGDMLNTSYSNSIDQQKVDQEASSGIGGLLGTLTAAVRGFVDEGGAIPETWSPTAGAQPDDVPVNLTAGEFVFPKEAVEVLGMDKLYKMRDKAVQMYADYETADEADQQAAISETV